MGSEWITRRGRGVVASVTCGAGVLSAAATARADVYQYSVGRGANYTQVSAAQPTTATAWNLLATVVAEEAILSSELTFERPPVVSFGLLEGNPNSWYYASPYYTTEAEFLQEFPATTYTLSADVGAGPAFGDAFLPESQYPDVPYFTGTTFDRLHAYDVSAAFAGTVNGFALPGGAEFGVSLVVVVDSTALMTVFTQELQPGETDFEIPAGLLAAGGEYSIGVTYYSWAQISDAGFGAATAIVEFSRGTGLLFRTLESGCGSCIPDLNCDGLVDFADYLEFLNLYEVQDLRVDFNHDALVDFADYLEFLNLYEAGC